MRLDPDPGSWAVELACTRTGARQPLDRPAFLSAAEAPLRVEYDLDSSRGEMLVDRLRDRSWDLWRYRELLPVKDAERRISLGEGATPLLRLSRSGPGGVELLLKQEAGNPTGSFKDRGLALAVSRAVELGAPGVELASAGNAAISIAAYAAAAALPCRVALPEATPGAVRRRCIDSGAEVLSGGSTLVEASKQLAAQQSGYWNLSTLREPYRLEGKKTMGLELAEQLHWQLPDWIIYPTGGGTGIIGMHKAFAELEALGLIGSARPRFVVVQAAGCAPMVRAWKEGLEQAEPWETPQSEIWGLRVPRALGDFLILQALRETDGVALTIDEVEVEARMRRLSADEGVVSGPEGAATLLAFDALCEQGLIGDGDRVVVFQTGHPANYAAS